MASLFRFWSLGGSLVLLSLLALPARAAEKTAAELMPASVMSYLEIPQPGKAVRLVLDHPLTAEVVKAPEYQQALKTDDYRRFLEAVTHLEGRLDKKWPEAIGSLTSGGLTMGFDLPTQGVVTLARSDEGFAEKSLTAVLELSRSVAAAQGQAELVKEDKHQGTPIYQIGEAHLAALGNWLVIANKKPLLRTVVDLHQGTGETLAADSQFQKVTKERTGQPAAWLYVDLRVLRLTGVLQKALNKKSDNPPVEILAGGILEAIPDAPYVTASLDVSPSKLKLVTSLPCDPKAVAKNREFYLGPEAGGVAPPLLAPKGTLLSLSTHRDFASLWRHAPDLFDEGINAKFAEAESNLTTFFAGRNFRDEILGNLQPGMQLVVTRQEFPQDGVTPAIKLPAVAAVFTMRQPEETTRIFKVTFQSAVGFLNVVGAMNGVDPLDLNSERVGEALVIASGYLPPKDEKARTEAALHFNASPTLAFVGDKFILSSARPLAMELIEHARKDAPAGEKLNTLVRVDGQAAQAALAENRGPLIAQNMLEKGHDRAAAENEIDRVLAALKVIQGSSLALRVAEAKLELSLEVELAAR
jgi:hypothetical protein